jgi:MFS family permease
MRNFWFARALGVNLLLAATMHGMRPVVSYRALALDAGPTGIGVIAASYGILALLMAVPAGRWVDRHGESLALVAGTVVVAMVGVVLALSTSLLFLTIGMMCLGAGQIMVAVAIQALIANGGSADGRDGRFGVQTVVTSFGQLIGPAAAGLLVAAALPIGQSATGRVTLEATDGVFWTGALVGLGTCLVALTLWRWPPRQHARFAVTQPRDPAADTIRVAFVRVLRVPSMPQAMLASLAVLSTIDIVVAYLPVYGVAYEIPVATVGLLLAVRGAASMVSRAFMLPLRRLLGRRRLLVGSIAAPAVTLLLLPIVGPATAPLFVAMALVGFGLGLGQPLTMSWVATRAPFDIRATAIGVRLSANRLGQFAVPATVGIVAGTGGLSAIFWSLAAMLAATAVVVMTAPFDAPGATDAVVAPP